ncbi:TPA: hypothetical protein ACNVRW_000649, partial [Citrobacter freundii]
MTGNHSILALSNVRQLAAIMLMHTAWLRQPSFSRLGILLILLALTFSFFHSIQHLFLFLIP